MTAKSKTPLYAFLLISVLISESVMSAQDETIEISNKQQLLNQKLASNGFLVAECELIRRLPFQGMQMQMTQQMLNGKATANGVEKIKRIVKNALKGEVEFNRVHRFTTQGIEFVDRYIFERPDEFCIQLNFIESGVKESIRKFLLAQGETESEVDDKLVKTLAALKRHW